MYIQQLITDGTLASGSGVSELLLAKELGSSRSPIPEAMNQSAAEGLLKQNTSGGMVLAELNRNDIIELYELREALEVYAVSQIARAPMRAADVDRLQHLVGEIVKQVLLDSGLRLWQIRRYKVIGSLRSSIPPNTIWLFAKRCLRKLRRVIAFQAFLRW